MYVCLFSIDASPKTASYYGNRAATLMMLCRFREALEDSQQAVRLDDGFMKVSFSPNGKRPADIFWGSRFQSTLFDLHCRDTCEKESVTCLWETPWRQRVASRKFWNWSPATKRLNWRWKNFTFPSVLLKKRAYSLFDQFIYVLTLILV